jgi:hypothetical protein
MNFEMAGANVQQHTNEIRRLAARCQGHSVDRPAADRSARVHRRPAAPSPASRNGRPASRNGRPASRNGRPASRNGRPSALRTRVGVTLVEAGLHLLAADGSQPTRP